MDKKKFVINCIEGDTPGDVEKMDTEAREVMDKAVAAYKKGEVVEFSEFIHTNQWHYFNEQTKGIPGQVELYGPLPNEWQVDSTKEIKVFNKLSYDASQMALENNRKFPFQGYKRDTQYLDKHFLLTYGINSEFERECVMQVLERLRLLEQSVYSRPGLSAKSQKHISTDYIFPITNDNVQYRNIEGTDKEHKRDYFYDLGPLPALYQAAKRVHCWVVLDVFPFNDNLLGVPTEKWVWPVFLGIPFIYIGSQRQMDVLSSWGIEPNDAYRNNTRGVAEQMMWLKSLFSDADLAKKWQGKQGPLVVKNRETLDRVPKLINPSK